MGAVIITYGKPSLSNAPIQTAPVPFNAPTPFAKLRAAVAFSSARAPCATPIPSRFWRWARGRVGHRPTTRQGCRQAPRSRARRQATQGYPKSTSPAKGTPCKRTKYRCATHECVKGSVGSLPHPDRNTPMPCHRCTASDTAPAIAPRRARQPHTRRPARRRAIHLSLLARATPPRNHSPRHAPAAAFPTASTCVSRLYRRARTGTRGKAARKATYPYGRRPASPHSV